jgi:hypothetical protein
MIKSRRFCCSFVKDDVGKTGAASKAAARLPLRGFFLIAAKFAGAKFASSSALKDDSFSGF